jgi:hypothetical protein
MAPVRICAQQGCRTRLSVYNQSRYCYTHETPAPRTARELNGELVQLDDDWLFRSKMLQHYPPAEIEGRRDTWAKHMMSERFIKGYPERLSAEDLDRYHSGDWLGGGDG